MGVKEYGGYFGLELPQREELFAEIAEEDKLRVNCGRAALYYAVKDIGATRVYMPYLNCVNSVDPIQAAGAEVVYYYLEKDLTPKDIHLKPEEALVWINYYGNATSDTILKVKNKYKSLIVDNCQAMFSAPIIDVYNCYSVRKFVGTADGGYLVKRRLKSVQPPQSFSSESACFLLSTIERGTNAVYAEYLESQKKLENNIAGMSPLTQRILCSIDYADIKRKRQRNFRRLHHHLKAINEFEINLGADTHMHYPLLVKQDGFRERLIERKIYTPTLWRHVPEQCGYAEIETILSNYMLFLPIDQRYDEKDMDDIAQIVLQEQKEVRKTSCMF